MSDTATLDAAPVAEPTPGDAPGAAPVARKGLLIVGTQLACAAGAMVIVTLLAAYTHFRDGTPGGEWPPPDLDIPNVVAATLTLTLIMSAVSVIWVLTAARNNDRRGVLIATVLTFVFGLAHINGLAFVFNTMDLVASHGVYESMVYGLLGTHTAMLVAGLATLLTLFIRALGGQVTADRHEAAVATVIVWEFVVVAWIAVYSFVFLIK